MNKFHIPIYVEKVMNCLISKGFECYLVGGCVRDFLMNIEPNDYDLATNAKPQEMKELFNKYKLIETGLKHGTCTVVSEGNNIEVTTYRIDGEYKDNRKPESVLFSSELSKDLMRRDFTVNALACSLDSKVADLFNGIDDLNNKIVRCVGEPNKRFNEDALRILRALRFSSVLGFEIEKTTSDSIHKNKNLLKNISKERIFAEFKKLLVGKNVEYVLNEYSDVICEFIPEFNSCIGFNQNSKYHCYDVAEHIIKAVSAIKPDINLRLAAFYHDIGKPDNYFIDIDGIGHFYGHADTSYEITKKSLKDLKADNKTIDYVSKLVKLHDRELETKEKAVKRFLMNNTEPFLLDLLELKRADAFAHAEKYRNRNLYFDNIKCIMGKIAEEKSCISLKTLKINGYDLITYGFSGKIVGVILNDLLLKVVDGTLENSKLELINYTNLKYKKEK